MILPKGQLTAQTELLPPPTLRERGHRGLARRLVAGGRRAILMMFVGEPHIQRADGGAICHRHQRPNFAAYQPTWTFARRTCGHDRWWRQCSGWSSGAIVCGLRVVNTCISFIQSSGAASVNTPPLVERRLLATVVVNARMINLRCFSLIRTSYSIDIIIPLMKVHRHLPDNLTHVLFGEV